MYIGNIMQDTFWKKYAHAETETPQKWQSLIPDKEKRREQRDERQIEADVVLQQKVV